MAIELITFSHTSLGQVAINPALVTEIHPHGETGTVITFDKDNRVLVQADFQSVFNLLTSDA